MLPDEFVTDCCREFEREGFTTDAFIRLLNKAAAAGRESAYTTDEWRVRSSKLLREWSTSWSREGADESLRSARQHYPDAWIEHRRTGATDWSRVDADA